MVNITFSLSLCHDGLDDNVFIGDLFITFIMIIIITQIFVIVTS